MVYRKCGDSSRFPLIIWRIGNRDNFRAGQFNFFAHSQYLQITAPQKAAHNKSTPGSAKFVLRLGGSGRSKSSSSSASVIGRRRGNTFIDPSSVRIGPRLTVISPPS
jgi:hypothetical protein